LVIDPYLLVLSLMLISVNLVNLFIINKLRLIMSRLFWLPTRVEVRYISKVKAITHSSETQNYPAESVTSSEWPRWLTQIQ